METLGVKVGGMLDSDPDARLLLPSIFARVDYVYLVLTINIHNCAKTGNIMLHVGRLNRNSENDLFFMLYPNYFLVLCLIKLYFI